VAALAEKHGKSDAWKFSRLMVRLAGKFPKSIGHKKTKEQQMMDDIMSGNFDKGADGGEAEQPKKAEEKKQKEAEPAAAGGGGGGGGGLAEDEEEEEVQNLDEL
jgi:hypothetical protein